MRRTFSRVWIFLLATASLLGAQAVTPGKFYEYYTVASTQAGTFTALGPPSINDNGLCAFTGTTAAGQTIWVSDGHFTPLRDINPGQANLGTNFFDPQLQINTASQVIAKDYIPGTSQNIRIWDALLTDSYVYLGRAGAGQTYTAIYGAPAINPVGDGVFGAIDPNGITHDLVEVSSGVTSTFAINSSAPQPAIATNGSMVVTTLNHATSLNQIILFANDFASQTAIASGTDFSYLDTTPGISDDGNVVVFQGNLTPAGVANLGITGGSGPGIFAAANTGTASAPVWQIIRLTGIQREVLNSGGNNDGICDPGETCSPGAELGYDDNNNPVYFSSYPSNTRVAVVNNDFGAPGIANDSFVVSFMGTPTGPSRTNPVTKTGPLLFSGNLGLWTIRVDVENELVGAKSIVFHPYTAIPVAQAGDQLGTNSFVSSISVNMPIANAAEDETGVDRTMRRGDHRVAFEATMNNGAQIIFRANHLDSSQDGILDSWKTSGIDIDGDGFSDISLSGMGAVVGQRDLFLEMDWLADQPGFNFHPSPGVVTAFGGGPGWLPAMLANAPALVGNMYGVRRDGTAPATIPPGIVMHIDGGNGLDFDGQPFSYNMGIGPLNGGDQIGMPGNNTALVEVLYLGAPGSINVSGVNTRSFQDAKDNYFGSQDKDARELAFKYAILADHHSFIDKPPANHPATGGGIDYILAGDPYPAGLTGGTYVKITGGTGAGQLRQISGFDTVILNKFYVTPNFTTDPDVSSTFVYISSSSGLAEVYFFPSPDNNSLPGNDFMLTLGDWGVSSDGTLMNTCSQWETLAHEMGHTLGLRHGGVDQQTQNASYHSLMSYVYQMECNPPTPVQSFSVAGDLVYDDFANLNHQSAQVFLHAGNSFGGGYGASAEDTLQAPEQNVLDYINKNGPIDLIKPVITITVPAAGSQVGSSLTVTIQATDNVAVANVKASFDANGDGVLSPSEIVTAVPAGGNLYTATFSSVTGSLSPRTLSAIAYDTSLNDASTSISLNVGTATQFALTVTEAGTGSGTVSSSPSGISCPTTCSANYNSGTPVTLTAAAGTGSTFAGWSGACTGTGTCAVTMSAAKAVTATFNTVQFGLTVTEAGTGSGTVSSSPSGISCPTTCSANYNSGTPVTLTATAGTGSTFAGWSGACTGTGSCAVTMSAAKAVTATFNTTPVQFALTVTEAGTGSGTVSSSPSGISCPTTCSANYNSGTPVTLTATAGTGSTFAGWSGACTGTGSCAVTMSAAQSVTATFNAVQFALTVTEAGTGSGTVSSSPSGISCPTTCSANYNSGTPVTLTATAGTGSTFAGWSGACSGTGSCAVTMSAAKAVTATFNTVQFALTVAEAGTGGGTVTSSPSGISCPTTCSANYNSGTPVTLTATAGTGSTFAGWSGACSGTGSCSVTMSAAQSVTATFNTTPVQFALTVTEAGTGTGSVSSSPSGISCPTTCSANYNSGTPVTLTATAGTGSTFAGWSGACSGTGSCSVTMSAAKAVTATFNTTPVQFALTVTEAGTGTGTVTSSPVGITCPTTCSANYNSGTPVTLTAAAGTGSTFAGWSGACTGTGSCAVTMSQAQSVTATFNTTPVQFALTVTEAGTGTGTVSSSPVGISCPSTCSANYNSGTPVTLTAAAGAGSTFAGWSGACTGTGSCSVTMSAAKAVTATFNTTPVQFALTVTEAGTGSGTVTSSPTGISCPTTCSANYNSGTRVTLTATAGTGSSFAGWSGACSGTGSCSVTMSAVQSVTATFNTTPVQFALTVTEAGTGSGTVSSSPSGISCPTTCSANYNSGTPVTLTAAAGTGSTFAGWSGACSGTGSCSVTMSAAQSVTATFNTTPVQFALTVTEAGTGSGTVGSSPSGINCPSTCSANYNSGTPVTLTATAGTSSTFAGWSGACSGTGSCSVTMSAAKAVTATFNTTPVQFALTVTETGTGTGTVTSSPTGISCPSTCSANYNSGTPVTLTATAGTGSTFAGWSGACSGTGSCSVTMSAAKAVTATFNTTPVQFALTVTEAGTGSGTVSSSPSGINCPSTCSANYNSGTPVTLTATAGTGSTFAGWSGACSGTGSCSVTMIQARAVTATFSGSGTGLPAISATIVARGSYSATVLFFDLQLKSVGSGTSVQTILSQILPATLGGTGTVTYNLTLSPMLPIAVGNLAPGGTFKVRLYLNVPSTVTKFMLTEKGSMSSATGTVLSYAENQTLSR